jgi:DNA-binding SARP family transcriptional activator/tetratricopeptide (TPR) repeat protein
MRVRVLGPVRICVSDDEVEVGPRQRCMVFAALAMDAGRLVPREALIDRVWGQLPPRGAWRAVQTHIANIRGMLRRTGHDGQAPVALVRQQGGYLLEVDRDLVDVHLFRRMVARAQGGCPSSERLSVWREAIGLWQGEPLTALSGDWAARTREHCYREYRDAVLGWAYAEIRTGDPLVAVAALTGLVERYPLDEALPAMLMRALYATGRRTDALDCYAVTRRRLDEELAERPGPELHAVYQAVLRREVEPPPPPGVVGAGVAVPAQLPADAQGFAGRVEQLAELDARAGAVGGHGSAVVVVAIAGTAGVGKTALAVHWAHRSAGRFPDGQLYVNLRGFDSTASIVDPADAVRGFLEALRVPAERVPVDRDAQAALYRTLLADKQMLILLDNARDSAQVRPLLPGAPDCLVLVTSRDQLTGLIATVGAHALPLDLLTADGARDLLTRRLGAPRVVADPGAVDTLVTQCARLPLALAIVAARAATHPHWRVGAIAAELAGTRTRLQALANADPAADLRAVFSWSYNALTPAAARLFRLYGLHPGPDISTYAAASLTGVPPPLVRSLLAELAAANLIAQSTPGRYAAHDLLRDYALDLARTTDRADERHSAIGRLLDHYLHTAFIADRMINPSRDPITIAAVRPGATPEHLADPQQALDWLTTEDKVLIATVSHAFATGFHTHAWQLAWALADYLDRRGHWHDQVAVQRTAVAAAEKVCAPAERATAHRTLAIAYLRLGLYDEADTHLRHAFDEVSLADDRIGQAHIHHVRATLRATQGHYTEALHHIERARQAYLEVDHRPGLASALNSTGWYHANLGDLRQAGSYSRQALVLSHKIDDPDGRAASWNTLGFVHQNLGQHGRAVRCYRHAIDIYRELGARYNEADSLDQLGNVHHASGNQDAAQTAWQQALTIMDRLHHDSAGELRSKLRHLDGSS